MATPPPRYHAHPLHLPEFLRRCVALVPTSVPDLIIRRQEQTSTHFCRHQTRAQTPGCARLRAFRWKTSRFAPSKPSFDSGLERKCCRFLLFPFSARFFFNATGREAAQTYRSIFGHTCSSEHRTGGLWEFPL